MNPAILVPTDFSENALLAAKFALSIAPQLKASVCLMHAYSWVQSAFQGEQAGEKARHEAEEAVRAEMEAFISQIPGHPNLEEPLFIPGQLRDAIRKVNSEMEVILWVMGTTGATGLRYHVLGSNTYEVARHLSSVPLIVVPPGITRFQLEKIGFFTDFNPGDKYTLTVLNRLFGTFSGEIKMIHFGDPEDEAEEEKKLADWAEALCTDTGIASLPYEWVSGEEGVEAIRNLGEPFDLLALTPIDRGFMENLITHSMAKELIHQSEVPVFLVSREEE